MSGLCHCHCHRHAALRDRPLPPRQLHPRRTRAGPRCPRSPGADTKPVLLPPRDPSGIAAAVPGIREQEPLASSSPGLQRLPGAACADTAPSPPQNPGPALLCPTFTARCAQSPPKLTRFTFGKQEVRIKPHTFPPRVRSKAAGSWEWCLHRGWTFPNPDLSPSEENTEALKPSQLPPSPSAFSSHQQYGPALPCQPTLVTAVISTCPGPGSPLTFTDVLGTTKCTQQLHQSDKPQFMPGGQTGAKGNHEVPAASETG